MASAVETPAVPALVGGRPEELLVRIAVLEERVKNRDEALQLQAKEYERRLEVLNHAHAQAEEKNRNYVTREVYDGTVREWTVWRNSIDYLPAPEFRVYKEATDRALLLREGQSKGIGATTTAMVTIVGVIGSVVVIAAAFKLFG